MRRSSFVVLAALTLGACGQPSVADLKAEAQAAYQDGDAAAALEAVDAALLAARAEGADRVALWNLEDLRVKVLTSSGDAEGVVAALERLGDDYPQQIGVARYVSAARAMQDVDANGSLGVMMVALDAFPDAKAEIDPIMSDLAVIAEASGNADMLGNLETLGYIGN